MAWYIALMSHALGLDMGHVCQENISKLEKRYPEGFHKEQSINRKE